MTLESKVEKLKLRSIYSTDCHVSTTAQQIKCVQTISATAHQLTFSNHNGIIQRGGNGSYNLTFKQRRQKKEENKSK